MSVDILRTSWDQCVSMAQYCFTSTETIRLVRTESPGRPPRLSHVQLLNCDCLHHCFFVLIQCTPCYNVPRGAEIAQWLERRTRGWLKGPGSDPCRSGWTIFFSRVNFLCWLLLRYPFHPRVTAAARKKSRCRWQVTAKYAYTLRMWLCMKWLLYGVHRTCAETAAVSYGTSHARTVSTPLRWIYKNAL